MFAKMFEWFRTLLFKRKNRKAETEEKGNNEQIELSKSKPASIPQPALAPKLVEISSNRKERRRLERLRKKHDKFVEPKGPLLPVSSTATTKTNKARKSPHIKVEVDDKTVEYLIADQHHEDRNGERVLFNESETYGEFNFRDTILQQLERYFVYLERMQKNDKDAYHLYKQVGAMVLPYSATGSDHREVENENENENYDFTLPPWFNKTRPSFGCFVYGADPETEKYELEKKNIWVPKFMYFFKYKKPPPELQPISGGDVYKMTVWWDRPFDSKAKCKHGTPQSFGIFIDRTGEQIIVLRQIDTKMVEIYSKRKKEFFHIPERAWHLPDGYEEWAKQRGKDPVKMLTNMFVSSVRRYEMSQFSMVRVAASKDNMTAVFGVNIKRTSYFFKDRDIQLNEAGHRQRIFHMVAAHNRKTSAGTTAIKFHFRGERQFTWAGYDISITIPGRDHYIINDFNIGTEDAYWEEKGIDYFSAKKIGKILAHDIKKGIGAY